MPGSSIHAQAWLLLLFVSISICIRTHLCSADDLIRSFPPSAMVLPLVLSINSSRPSIEGNFRRLLRREKIHNTPDARMRLYDDLLANGYYTTRLFIGTPPQEFALIVDTGSTVTYVPCSTCEQCGLHQDPRFQPDLSSTYQPVKCSVDCTCDEENKQCTYERQYAEMSSSSGVLGEDVVSFGKESTLQRQRAVFGCENVETGDLFSQHADGIIGLGRGQLSIMDQLANKGVISDSFSLCYGGMGVGGGAMVLGGISPPPGMVFSHSNPARSPYYNVELKEIHVAGKPLQLSNDNKPYTSLRHPKPPSPARTSKSSIGRRRTLISCSKRERHDAWKKKKVGLVDYDEGTHRVATQVSGLGRDDLPKRFRLRVDDDRFQRDWKISEVVDQILKLKHWEDVEGVLNRWAGRFARKNFPVLIREITKAGSLEHSVQVFNWMKNQKNYCARNDIYNMMIRLHARHNRTDQARGLFFEMQEWRCKPDAETYNALINAHGRAHQWRWAMNIMDDMLRAAIPPSRSTYNNLINACGSSGNWKEALKVCKKMTDNGVGPDLVTHNIVLSAFKSGSKFLKALSYFELMKGTHIRPDTITLNIVIHCLVKLGRYGEAVDVFNSMRDKRAECKPDVVTFTSIIHAYSVCGQIENCKATFDMMLAEGLKPNIVSYNALIGAYASHGMHEEALEVFNLLKHTGFRPDVVSYTSLLNAYGRSGQPEKARDVFDMIKRNSWKPNLVSYNALIDAYGSQGLLAEAVEVLREMERDGVQPNIVTICTLLAACGRCGQMVKIDTILLAAESREIKLNTVAYNSAIGSYLSVGEYDKALNLYRSMRGKGCKPDSVTFNILISGTCKMGKYGESLKFLNEMMDLQIPLSKEVFSSAISAYSKQGQLPEAESMFNMMKIDGCCPDVVTYTTMIHAYSTAENWEKALSLFEEMEMNDIQPDSIACSSLMKVFNKGCQPARVLLLAELMKEKGIALNETSIFEIISACSMLRDWRTAINLIEKMDPSFFVYSVGLQNQLLHFLGKSGKIEIMMKLFFKIVSSGTEINLTTYSILLKNLLAAGKWRRCIEVLNWMEDAGIQPSLEMYSNVLSYACKDNSTKYAAFIREKIDMLKKKDFIKTPSGCKCVS